MVAYVKGKSKSLNFSQIQFHYLETLFLLTLRGWREIVITGYLGK